MVAPGRPLEHDWDGMDIACKSLSQKLSFRKRILAPGTWSSGEPPENIEMEISQGIIRSGQFFVCFCFLLAAGSDEA